MTAQTAPDAWQLRLARGDTTYLADLALPADTAITGIRLYKNPDGPGTPSNDLLFDRLRVAPDSGAPAVSVPLDAPLQRTTLFYEDGNAFDAWTLSANGAAGAWRNTGLLCNIGLPSFGLWANNGGTSTLRRRFGFSLTNGCDLSFSFQNNSLDDPAGSAGATLLTDTGESFTLLAAAGAPNYLLRIAGTGETIDTGIPVVKTGIEVAAAPAEDGTLALTVAGKPFALDAPSAISGIEFFNRSAGSGTACNVFANRVWVRAVPGTAPAPSDPDPTPAPSILFHETGADIANWYFYSWTGITSNGWAGSGSEYSAILGPDTFYLYAGSSNDANAQAIASRFLPEDLSLGAGTTLSFRFAHGEVGEYGFGSVGWELFTGSNTAVFAFGAVNGEENYLAFFEDSTKTLDAAMTPGTAHVAEFRFHSETNADFLLDGNLLAADIGFDAPVRQLRFWNWMAGAGSARNFLFNDITVTAPAEADPAARSLAKKAEAAPETLLSTNLVYTLVPSNDIAVTARFVPRQGTDFEIWAADRGIGDPWITNPETGRGYAEEYLLETNAISSLQQAHPDGTYELSFESGQHGIAADIQVSDSLSPAVWRTPTDEELRPVASGDPGTPRFLPVPTNQPPRLFIRLSLRPAE